MEKIYEIDKRREHFAKDGCPINARKIFEDTNH